MRDTSARGDDAARGVGMILQDAVDPDAHLQVVAAQRLEMDVARPQATRAVEDSSSAADDRRAAGEVAQRVGIVGAGVVADRGVRGTGVCGRLCPLASSASSMSSKVATSSVTSPPSVTATASIASALNGSAVASRSVPSAARYG